MLIQSIPGQVPVIRLGSDLPGGIVLQGGQTLWASKGVQNKWGLAEHGEIIRLFDTTTGEDVTTPSTLRNWNQAMSKGTLTETGQ